MHEAVSESSGPVMEVRGLAYETGGRCLIDGVDLAVQTGRRLALMGANGAGKSVLLRLLHGLLHPTSGSVLWKGQALDRAARSRQAMVFQRPVLLRRSVLSNLRFALGVRRLDPADREARVREALAHARLADLARHPARVLSGGEQQRLAVVRALACQPELLLLDEPTASLDPVSVEAIETLVGAAHARGVSVVLVTHDRGQARRLADDIAFLHAGKMVEFGPAGAVLDAPRSEAARAWMEGRLYTRPPGEDSVPVMRTDGTCTDR